MTLDALVWIPRMLYLYPDASHGLPPLPFTVTVLVRDLAVMGMCALVVRQIYRPDQDLVRFGGRVDDPSGGFFENAADAPPRWLPAWLRPRSEEALEPADTVDASSEEVVSAQHPT
jgi:uncharacterized membrane protein